MSKLNKPDFSKLLGLSNETVNAMDIPMPPKDIKRFGELFDGADNPLIKMCGHINELKEIAEAEDVEQQFQKALNFLWFTYLHSKDYEMSVDEDNERDLDISACAAYILKNHSKEIFKNKEKLYLFANQDEIPFCDFPVCTFSLAMELVHQGHADIKKLMLAFMKKWEKDDYKRYKKFSSVKITDIYEIMREVIEHRMKFDDDFDGDRFITRKILIMFLNGASFDNISKGNIIMSSDCIRTEGFSRVSTEDDEEDEEDESAYLYDVEEEVLEAELRSLDGFDESVIELLKNKKVSYNFLKNMVKEQCFCPYDDIILRYGRLSVKDRYYLRIMGFLTIYQDDDKKKEYQFTDIEWAAYLIFMHKDYFKIIDNGYHAFLYATNSPGCPELPQWMPDLDYEGDTKTSQANEKAQGTENVSDPEIEKLKEQLQQVKDELAECRAALSSETMKRKNLSQLVSELKDVNKQLDERNEDLLKMVNELVPEGSDGADQQEEIPDDADDSENEEQEAILESEIKPFIKDKKILVVGGHDNWLKKIKRHFPNWQIVTTHLSVTEAKRVAENKELVIMRTDSMSHPMYWAFMNAQSLTGFDILEVRYNNMNKFVHEIYKKIS